jgi:precorrin-6B methylase 2
MDTLVKIKKLLKKILPTRIFAGLHNFARNWVRPLIDKKAAVEIAYLKKFVARYGLIVTSGPFEGMKYVQRANGSVLLLKLVGCYEFVLHTFLNNDKSTSYDTIIDIGCAEGYYLIGLSLHHPEAKLIGYDTEPDALELLQELAKTNNIKNQLALFIKCEPKLLETQITQNTLLICDAEGFEHEILNPQNTKSLKDVQTIIVETHDHIISNTTQELITRFSDTHTAEELQYSKADKTNYPFLSEITKEADLDLLLDEREIENQTVLILSRK